MVYDPPAIPVTTPVDDTVPIAVFDDDHVPPVVDDDSVEVLPIHNKSEPVIAPGRLTIVIVCIL